MEAMGCVHRSAGGERSCCSHRHLKITLAEGCKSVSEVLRFSKLRGTAQRQAISKLYPESSLHRLSVDFPNLGHVKTALREVEHGLAAAAAKHKAGEHRFAFVLALQAANRVFAEAGG